MDTLLQLFLGFWLLAFAVGAVFCVIGVIIAIVGALAYIAIPIALAYGFCWTVCNVFPI